MAQGRGSATIMLLLSMFVLSFMMVHATNYVVGVLGDADGWTFDKSDWPKGKNFKAGDILEFNYDPSEHNVVKVMSKEDYDSCSASEGSKTFQSGKDKITLSSGNIYFICTFPAHCLGGMRIAVDAA